jgi:endonuclease/exonuclease/phosphatase (EEP) superfamily protein YafD
MAPEQRTFFRFSIRLWGLVQAAGVVGCVATVLGFLGRFHWLLDLFSHFRVQYLLGLSCLGLVLLIGRRRKTAIACLMAALLNAMVVLPLFFGEEVLPTSPTKTFRVLQLNVNTQQGDPQRVLQLIDEVDPDFIVLEELNRHWIQQLSVLETKYPHSLVSPREDNFGIGLYSKWELLDQQIVEFGSAEVPSAFADLSFEGIAVRVIATHPLPPMSAINFQLRNEQLAKLAEAVDSGTPTLMLGDFNATPWNYFFRNLLKESGLRDSSRGFGIQPTWPSFSRLLSIPIDHCLHSEQIVIVGREIGPDVGSDHYPVIVEFTLKSEKVLEPSPD